MSEFDVRNLCEGHQIEAIAESLNRDGEVQFIVESNEQADRYLSQLSEYVLFPTDSQRKQLTVVVVKRIVPMLVLFLLASCAEHKPIKAAPVPSSIREPIQYKECSLKGEVAICECKIVRQKIDSKSGKVTSVC